MDGVYYASSLRSPRVEKDRSSCTEIVCIGRGIDESDYEQQHVPGCDKKCKQISGNERVLEIIQRGGIPLISYTPEKAELRVVDYGPNKSYLAISHVYVLNISKLIL